MLYNGSIHRGLMNLTRKQITIVVASIFAYQNKYRLYSEIYKDIDELIELFDLEHQRTLLELAQDPFHRGTRCSIMDS
jgi:hypothetical protein